VGISCNSFFLNNFQRGEIGGGEGGFFFFEFFMDLILEISATLIILFLGLSL